MFGYVPVEFADEQQMFLGELISYIKDVNKEHRYEAFAKYEKLAKIGELTDEFTLTMHNLIDRYDEVIKKEIL